MKKILIMMGCIFFSVDLMANCPIVYPSDIGTKVKKIDRITLFRNIYFCQQNFDASYRNHVLKFSELSSELTGKQMTVSLGSVGKIEGLDVSSTTLVGASIPNMDISKGIIRFFPEASTGEYQKSSIFNFYIRLAAYSAVNDCNSGSPDWYNKIQTYLRNNASMFRATTPSGGVQLASASYGSGEVAVIKDMILEGENGGQLLADLYFKHANPGEGQYFTEGTQRMCWYGIKTRMHIHPDNTLKMSGDYKVRVEVLGN